MSEFDRGTAAFDAGDYKSALEAWLPLATAGDAEAQKSIGILYAKGLGIAKDLAEAESWLQKSAKQGNPHALYRLAKMLAANIGTGESGEGPRAYAFAMAAAKNFQRGRNRKRAYNLAKLIMSKLHPSDRMRARMSPEASAFTGSATPQKLNPRDIAIFKKAVLDHRAKIAAKSGPVIVGSAEMLDLEELQKRAGFRWPAVRDQIGRIVDQSFEYHLCEADLYFRASDTSTLVVFGSLLPGETRQVVKDIGHEIERRLAEEVDGGTEAGLQAETVTIDSGPDNAAIATVETLVAAVKAETAKIERTARAAMPNLRERARISYWPLAHLRKRLISVYEAAFLPDTLPGGGAAARNDFLKAELDTIAMEQAAAALNAAGGLRLKAAMMVPVNYETLANRRLRTLYVAALKTLSVSSSRRTILRILDIPDGMPQGRLHQILGLIKPYVLGFAAAVPMDFRRVEVLVGVRLFAITVDGSSLDGLTRGDFERLKRLVARASRHRIRVAYLGARTIEVGQLARMAGVTYTNGPAVFPRVNDFGKVVRV